MRILRSALAWSMPLGVPRRVALVATVVTATYVALFPYRMDYAAHVLAGFSAVLLLALLAEMAGIESPWVLFSAVLAVAILGLLGENTLLGPDLDAVDIANSVLGAVVGAASAMSVRPHRLGTKGTASVAFAGLAIAAGMRFVLFQGVYP